MWLSIHTFVVFSFVEIIIHTIWNEHIFSAAHLDHLAQTVNYVIVAMEIDDLLLQDKMKPVSYL